MLLVWLRNEIKKGKVKVAHKQTSRKGKELLQGHKLLV